MTLSDSCNDSSPEVSIIIPVYNVEPFLNRCVDSVLRQKYRNFELILVDDGSSDRSGEICDQYKLIDTRIHVIHKGNEGPGYARNAGLDWLCDNSNSRWIFFVDSDDWIHQSTIEILLDVAKTTCADTVIGGYAHTKGEEPYVDVNNPSITVWTPHDCFIESGANTTIPVCKLYKRELFKNIRYPDRSVHEDEFITYRILEECNKIAYVNQPFYAYFYNPDSITHRPWSLERLDAIEAMEKRVNHFKNLHIDDLYNWSLNTMFITLKKNIETLESSESSIRDANLKNVRVLLRRKLHQYRSVFRFAGHLDIYAAAYPALIKPILKILSILQHSFIFSLYYKIREISKIKSANVSITLNNNSKLSCRSNCPRIILSLTSFPERIPYVDKAIRSLLNQNLKPDKIILWLAKPQFPNGEKDLPHRLLKLKKYGLEICWTDTDIRSYKKLIPALKEYPDDIIVTADDDVYWSKDHLVKLINSLDKHPWEIQCHRITKIAKVGDRFDCVEKSPSMMGSSCYSNKLVGVGGVAYPPHCLDIEVLNQDAFLRLAPTSDDIWFWGMALKHGTKIRWVENSNTELLYIGNIQFDTPCLTAINDNGDRLFYEHLNNVINEYKLGGIIET